MCSIYEFKCYIYDIYVKDMHYYLKIWQDFSGKTLLLSKDATY